MDDTYNALLDSIEQATSAFQRAGKTEKRWGNAVRLNLNSVRLDPIHAPRYSRYESIIAAETRLGDAVRSAKIDGRFIARDRAEHYRQAIRRYAGYLHADKTLELSQNNILRKMRKVPVSQTRELLSNSFFVQATQLAELAKAAKSSNHSPENGNNVAVGYFHQPTAEMLLNVVETDTVIHTYIPHR